MPEQERPEADRQDYPAEKARQGQIVLRSRARRLIFVAGLVAAVVLALLVRVWLAH